MTEGVIDWRELVPAEEGKSQFISFVVTISQPGMYQLGVYAFNKLDEQNPHFPYMWGNSDREECFVLVISSIGFTGNQLITINQFWIAIFLIAGLGICVWWLNTYPSHRSNLVILLYISFLVVCIVFGIGVFMPFGIFALLSMVIPLLLVFLTIPKGHKDTSEVE